MNIDTRALNKVLAEFCGAVRIEKRTLLNVMYHVSEVEEECYILKNGDILCAVSSWNPLTDHNNLALVEAALREKGCDYGIEWNAKDGHYTAHVMLDPNPSGDPKILYKTGMALDKLIALALAVQAMQG